MKDQSLVGPDGKPLKPISGEPEFSLQIQAFIEARVNTNVETAREILRSEANAARRESNIRHWIGYAAFAIAAALFAVITWVFGSSEVRELTGRYVAEHMNKP